MAIVVALVVGFWVAVVEWNTLGTSQIAGSLTLPSQFCNSHIVAFSFCIFGLHLASFLLLGIHFALFFCLRYFALFLSSGSSCSVLELLLDPQFALFPRWWLKLAPFRPPIDIFAPDYLLGPNSLGSFVLNSYKSIVVIGILLILIFWLPVF